MSRVVTPKKGDWTGVKQAIQQLASQLAVTAIPTFASFILTDLTASAIVGTDASKVLESVTVGTGLDYSRPNLTLSHLGIEDLTDPGADRIFFWDNTASASKWLVVGNSIAITNTTVDTIQDIRTTASPTFANLSLGTGELTTGSINRASGTLTLEIGGTAEISITSSVSTFGGNIVIPDTGYIGSTSDPNAIRIAANGEVTFTDVATGILPTTGAHLATKEYVDLAIGALDDYFLSDNDDPVIANYHILQETDTGEAASTEVTAAMGINPNQLMFSFITSAGVPGVTFLRSGVYILHTHLAMTTGNRTVVFYWTLSKYTTGDVETVLMTSEVSTEIPDSEISFNTHAVLASDTAINDTDRLVLKLYANVTGGGQNPVITIYMEGTDNSHLTNLLPSSIWQTQGDVLDDLNMLGIVGADSEFLVGTASGALAWESGATVRTSLGLGNVEDTVHSTDAHTMTIDGRDVSVDGTKLDGIEALADVTATAETSHADVLQDGDFGSNGLMERTGVGSYGIKAIGTDVQAYHANLAAIAAGTWTGAASITTLGTITTCGGITLADGGVIRCAGAPIVTFNDTGDTLVITGCQVGIGTAPSFPLHVVGSIFSDTQFVVTNVSQLRFAADAGGVYFLNDSAVPSYFTTSGAAKMEIGATTGIWFHQLKSGANQGAAGAAAKEIWVDTADQTIKLGV